MLVLAAVAADGGVGLHAANAADAADAPATALVPNTVLLVREVRM
jgi:hypothetical protein